MHIPSELIISDAVTLYGVGCYRLDATGVRTGPMRSIRLYTKIGPAKAFRTRSQKFNATQLAVWPRGAPQSWIHIAPTPEQWVVFSITGSLRELP